MVDLGAELPYCDIVRLERGPVDSEPGSRADPIPEPADEFVPRWGPTPDSDPDADADADADPDPIVEWPTEGPE